MSAPPRSFRPPRTGPGYARLAALALLCLAASGPARAVDSPAAVPPAPAVPETVSPLIPNPVEVLAAMARELDRHADTVVLMIEKTPITQAELADVVRTMPSSFANLGFAEVSKRALDVLVSQKAMALDAKKDGIDKDPAVQRAMLTATDRVLADVWLTRHVAATVTEQAVHDRYNRDIAGRPGPDEVRARVILLPTEAEARAVIAKARAGAEFEALARDFSKAPNAAHGGDLGYATFGSLSPDIAPVIFALLPGQITPFPVRSPVGWFVIRIEGRRQRGTPSFEEASPELRRKMESEAVEATIHSVLDNITVVPTEKTPGAPASH